MSPELILGGARSGKSRHAEHLAAASGLPVTVIVTAEALDAEMAARIARHQADRPAAWRTVEAPRALADTLVASAAHGHCVVVDCLTLWLANLLAGAEDLPPAASAEALPDFLRLHVTPLLPPAWFIGAVRHLQNGDGTSGPWILAAVKLTALGAVLAFLASRLLQRRLERGLRS